jgi:hypothetical protein
MSAAPRAAKTLLSSIITFFIIANKQKIFQGTVVVVVGLLMGRVSLCDISTQLFESTSTSSIVSFNPNSNDAP